MALRGDLRDLALADIFELLLQQGKTGKLSLTFVNESAIVVFESGKIVYGGENPGWLDRMAALNLMTRNKASREQLEQFMEFSRKNKCPFFETLIKQNLIDEAEYWEMINVLEEDFICDLFHWKEGSYHFDADTKVKPYKIWGLSFDTQGIIMEGMRRHDEWMLMKNLISSSKAVFRKHKQRQVEAFKACSRSTDSENLTDSEEIWVRERDEIPLIDQLFLLIDGEKSVDELCKLVPKGKFHIFQALVELIRNQEIVYIGSKKRKTIREKRQDTFSNIVKLVLFVMILFFCLLICLKVRMDRRQSALEARNELSLNAIVERLRMEKIVLYLYIFKYVHNRFPRNLQELVQEQYLSQEDIRNSNREIFKYHIIADDKYPIVEH